MAINGTVTAVTGATVTLRPNDLTRAINIGGAGGLNLMPTEIQQVSVTGGTLQIGRSDGTGTLSVSTAIAPSDINAGTLKLVGGAMGVNAPISVNGNLTLSNSGTLTIAAAGDITATTAVTQDGTGSVVTAGDVTTGSSSISFAGTVSLTGPVALAPGGLVLFQQTVNGAQPLTINGGLQANNAIGNLTPLSGITQSGGSVTLLGNVTTSGSQSFDSGIGFLETSVVHTSTAGSIALPDGVCQACHVDTSASGGAITISGPVGNLRRRRSVTLNAGVGRFGSGGASAVQAAGSPDGVGKRQSAAVPQIAPRLGNCSER